MAVRLRWCLAVLALSLPAQAGQELAASNTSRPIGTGQWEWTVFLKGPKAVLDRISCVEYALHPTFPDPVRKICDRSSDTAAFPLRAVGWGTFPIRINVMMRSGEVATLTHDLVFEARRASPEIPVSINNDAEKVGARLWDWTAYLKAPEDVLSKVACVEYTLHPTFPNPVQEVCSKGSSDKPFPVTAKGWGTFNLKGKVVFMDGSVRELEHLLNFTDAGSDRK